jgi:hypothetical protein
MSCENPKQVASGMKAEVPSWSANGEFLYFASDRTGRWEVWKQASTGGQAIQITHNGGYVARESPDGKWLYFSKDRMEYIWRIPAQSAGEVRSHEELVIGPPNNLQQKGWALTSDEIIATERGPNGRPGALRAYQISSRRTRLILPSIEGVVDSRDYSISVSADSKWILYSQLDRSGSNVMVADNP